MDRLTKAVLVAALVAWFLVLWGVHVTTKG